MLLPPFPEERTSKWGSHFLLKVHQFDLGHLNGSCKSMIGSEYLAPSKSFNIACRGL
uniref:Uncharacterized protein n=1 Tax=Anguilla anguilla TaxID=7936 RepID=A0A0E9V780_ANGAN